MTDTEAPYPDIPRLRKIDAWVAEQELLPEDEREWRQESWITSPAIVAARINTRMANKGLAEHAAVELEALRFDCGTKSCVCGRVAIEDGAKIGMDRNGFLLFDGKRPTDYGLEALGLLPEEDVIFSSYITAADFHRCAQQIAARVGETL